MAYLSISKLEVHQVCHCGALQQPTVRTDLQPTCTKRRTHVHTSRVGCATWPVALLLTHRPAAEHPSRK